MRKGFALVEMLVIVVVLPFLFVIVDGLFRTLLADIPLSHGVVQENTTLLNMLDQLRQDVDQARGLPESFAGPTAGEHVLLIGLADGVVSYELKDGRAIRSRLPANQAGQIENARVWSLPHAKVTWRVWTTGGRGYAVETAARIEQKLRGRWKEKMVNSHLYFVGSFRKAGVPG